MKHALLIISYCWITIAFAQQEEGKSIWEKSRLTALIDSRTAYQYKETEISKSELIIRPELEVPLTKNLRFVTIGRFYVEWMDKLEPEKPDQEEVADFSKRAFAGDRFEFELREFYFDWKINKHYLTVGKQQIVWGEADGLKILDVVNPINLREFLLDDFDQSRIPLWSVKADIDLDIVTAQLIFVPDQTYHDIPDFGSQFFPGAFFPSPPQNISVEQREIKKPNDFISDADLGLRLSSFINGWDLSLNYLYHYDDFPVVSNSFNDESSTLIVTPSYRRHHLIGSTFNNSFGSFTLRGEFGLSIDKYFNTTDPETKSGSRQSQQFAGVLGLDYYGISNTTISAQSFLDFVFEDMPLIGRERTETNASLLINRTFLNQTITAEVIAVQNLNIGDGFVRPSIKWLTLNNLNLKLGADIIYGKKDRLFGQFRDKSRIVLSAQLGI